MGLGSGPLDPLDSVVSQPFVFCEHTHSNVSLNGLNGDQLLNEKYKIVPKNLVQKRVEGVFMGGTDQKQCWGCPDEIRTEFLSYLKESH